MSHAVPSAIRTPDTTNDVAYAYEHARGYAWYRDLEEAAADDKLADFAAIPDRLLTCVDMNMSGADMQAPSRRYRAACQASVGLALLLGSAHFWAGAAVLAGVAIATFAGWTGAAFYIEGHRNGTRHAASIAIRLLRRRDVPIQEVDVSRWGRCPPAPEGHGHLYAIRFHTGVVKVGQTNSPARRIGEHRRDAWAYGVVITDLWISRPHAEYLSNEVRLIAFTAKSAERARREYFHGVNFAAVVEFASTLAAVEGAPA